MPGSKFVFDDISDYYKTVNIYKFSQHFSRNYYVPFLDAYSKALGNNEYYEQVLRVITMLDDPEIRAKKLNGQLWHEIDDIQDLDIASSVFSPESAQRMASIQSRYGDYWHYPRLLDFCYLVNPYFPPQKLMDEMKTNFETLLTQYPSGNYIPKADVLRLAQWCQDRSIRLIVDESFVDFADEEDSPLIHEDILQRFPYEVHLCPASVLACWPAQTKRALPP